MMRSGVEAAIGDGPPGRFPTDVDRFGVPAGGDPVSPELHRLVGLDLGGLGNDPPPAGAGRHQRQAVARGVLS